MKTPLSFIVGLVIVGCNSDDITLPANIPYTTRQDSTLPDVRVLRAMDKFNEELKQYYSNGGSINFLALVEYDRETGAPVFQLSLSSNR